ncbi:MAG: penicillin-binding protein activator [Alphaproteobacteria bacterium]|nr:penicillin-binding protein activator [Alphaproteobacteria bacterium]MDP7172602.1 penicillin-binding protein activator [Alphaproteobacteria bacterium]MDP7234273.1 penicillin-binding protein activator [Alphaproteobacteria bacterium]
MSLLAACADTVTPLLEIMQGEPPSTEDEVVPVVPATQVDLEPLNLPAPETPLTEDEILPVVPAIEVDLEPLNLLAPEMQPPQVVDREPGAVRVAILLPLSGPGAGVGLAFLKAAQLALFDHAGDDFVLMPKDTAGTNFGAEQAMREALVDSADIVLGPLTASSVRAVSQLAQSRSVPILAFTNDSSVARANVYVLGITPAQEVERIVGYAASNGYARIAALVSEDEYGTAVQQSLIQSAARHVADVGQVEYFVPGQVSAGESVPVRSLVSSGGFDTLLIAAGGRELRLLAPLFPYYDLDPDEVRFLGTSLWGIDQAVIGEPALIDGWFAAAPDDDFAGFAARYHRAYGRKPPRRASLAYDALALTALLANAPGGADFSRETLTNDEGFVGIDGLFRLREDGYGERALAVYRVTARGFEVIDPAPTALGGAVF